MTKTKNASQIVSFFFFNRGHSNFLGLHFWFALILGRRETITLYSPHTYLRFLDLVSFWNEIFSVIPFAPCIHTNQPIDPIRAHVVCPNKQIALTYKKLVSQRELSSLIPVPVYPTLRRCYNSLKTERICKLSYSQTRSSVPVANELMNSFTEKWFRLLIQ